MLKRINIGVIIALLLYMVPLGAYGQKGLVSTNALSWAALGTINAEVAYSVDRHYTIHAGGVANPWEFNTSTSVRLLNKQYGGFLGVRYWPWNVYSEWWVGAKAQYKQFQHVGVLLSEYIEGKALGVGIQGGYSYMISNHFNKVVTNRSIQYIFKSTCRSNFH